MEPRNTGSTTSTTRPPATTPPAPPPGPSSHATGAPGGQDPGHDRRASLGWGLALILAGSLWLLWSSGVALRWELVLPVVLIGIGLLVLARPRAEGGGLIGLGIVVLVLGLVQPGLPTTMPFTAGERSHTIVDIADLDASYALGAGSLVLDLRELDLAGIAADAGPVEVAARVTFGELIVLVPEDVQVRGDARVAFGEVAHFGRADGGVGPRVELDEPAGDQETAGDGEVLELDLRVAFGQIEVQR
jgi:hypothetical protein